MKINGFKLTKNDVELLKKETEKRGLNFEKLIEEDEIVIFKSDLDFLDWMYINGQNMIGLIETIRDFFCTNIQNKKEEDLGDLLLTINNVVKLDEDKIAYIYNNFF